MDFLCYIVVSSLIFFLSKFLIFTCVAYFHLFFHIICTGSFHWSYRCDALDNFSWWPVPVQHITTLLFWPLNHFWITIDELSMHLLLTPVLFKFLYFLFFKFFTRYSIFSIDCLSCSNSLYEVFFRIGNIKIQTIVLFSNTTFHTYQTSIPPPPFLFINNPFTSHFGRNAPYIVIVFLDFLSTFVNSLFFHCRIPAPYLIQPFPMHLLLLSCFSDLVLILGPIEGFSFIPLLFFISFHPLWSYPIQLCPNMCILPFRSPSLLHNLGALFLHV